MAHIRPVPPDEAEGETKREYDRALRRADRIWNIVSIQSHNGPVLRDSMRLYSSTMYGESPLSRAQREMIAVVTSGINGCHY